MYNNKKVIHIVAVGKNNEIGLNDKMLWHIPADFKYFKEKTIGNVLIMGRKTFEGLPNPLSRRVVLKCTRQWDEHGADLDECLRRAEELSDMLNTDCIYIAGGSQIYKATEPYVDELLITEIASEFPEADAFYSRPEGFELKEAGDFAIHKQYSFCFTTWKKS